MVLHTGHGPAGGPHGDELRATVGDAAVVCTFRGADQAGGEYASDTTTIVVRQTRSRAFDLVSTTTSRTSMPGGGKSPPPQTSATTDRLVLGAPSCAPPP